MKVVCTPPNHQDQALIRQWQTWANRQWQTWANDPTVSNQQRDFRQVAARRVTNYRYHPHNEKLDLSNLNLDGTLPPVPLTEMLMVHGNPGLTGIASLPPGLRLLSAGHCGLEQLPKLPETLEHLWVPKNPRISTLPRIPNAIKSLNVANCGLRRLDSFSDQSRLESLDVSDNQLGSLPSLPKHLNTLTAKGCGLIALPVITSSFGLTLDFSNNQIVNISQPMLPASTYRLNLSANLVQLDALPHWMMGIGFDSMQYRCMGQRPGSQAEVRISLGHLPNANQVRQRISEQCHSCNGPRVYVDMTDYSQPMIASSKSSSSVEESTTDRDFLS